MENYQVPTICYALSRCFVCALSFELRYENDAMSQPFLTGGETGAQSLSGVRLGLKPGTDFRILTSSALLN